MATGEPSKKPRVSAGGGMIIGVPPTRQTTPQSSAVPLTTSTPMLTLTTTSVSHERLGSIPQMILTEIPGPPAITSTVSLTILFPSSPPHEVTQPPPPPMPCDISYIRSPGLKDPFNQYIHHCTTCHPTIRQKCY